MKKYFYLFGFVLFMHCASDIEKIDIAAYTSEIKDFRRQKDLAFADSIYSPLLKNDVERFPGLKYYDADTRYLIEATFEVMMNGEIFTMPSTGGIADEYKKAGVLHFELDGKKLQLSLYDNLSAKKNGTDFYFIPFSDLTNLTTTYEGGRYLDLKIPETKDVLLDFNKAYNPYCAYNPEYSCPIPPSENHLDVIIEAGEKRFHTISHE